MGYKKMKIKHFIVTYNNEEILHKSLCSIFDNWQTEHDVQVFVINNHSNFILDPSFVDKVSVLNNQTRPDFSTGHLSRNWNEAIINGFKNLNNPDCDILVASQNDCVFAKNYVENLVSHHRDKGYNFVAYGPGDNCCSYTAEGVRRIGLWDERFCNIGYQEYDYFLRAFIYNADKSSLNDYMHNSVVNPIPREENITEGITTGYHRGDSSHHASMQYHGISRNIYSKKWGRSPEQGIGNHEESKALKPLLPCFMYYPYFEKDIVTLAEQNYI